MKITAKLKAGFLCVLSALLVACSTPNPTTTEIFSLDTLISVTSYSANEAELEEAKKEIYALENLLSATKADSDISKINSANGKWVVVEKETFELIKKAVEISENTGGRFDVTVFPAVRLWGFTTDNYKVPTSKELEEVKKTIDYNNIELDSKTNSIRLLNGAQIDLGAIAKGYIADKTAELLKTQGEDGVLLNFGGNVRALGTKPDGKKWVVGIKKPEHSSYFAKLSVGEGTVSTAGGYQRFFEENGEKYHHILDPKTAAPSDSGALSVSVVGADGAVCDALATAIYVGGSESVRDIMAKYTDYSVVLLESKKVYVSKSIIEDFTLTDGNTYLEIVEI